MRTKLLLGACGVAAVTLLLGPAQGWAQRWDARREAGEGAREIRRERREAAREIVTADSAWEVRHEIHEGRREVARERIEARHEVRRELRQEAWRWDADIIWRFDLVSGAGIWPHDGAHCPILIRGPHLYLNSGTGVGNTNRKIRTPDAPSLVVLDKATGRLLARDGEHIAPFIFHSTWSTPSMARRRSA